MTTPHSAAYELVGLTLHGGWHVDALVELPDDHTGAAFSVGYLVSKASGERGFLKALDYAAAFDADDPAAALEELTGTYNAERMLLEHCRSRGLDRIVRALDAGSVRVEGYPLPVDYLILERADGDARTLVSVVDTGDQGPMLQLGHHAAVGLRQLHGIGGRHQDFKPSNLLWWEVGSGRSGKLGDLGAAYLAGRPAPHDLQVIAGTCAHASPEQLYGCGRRLSEARWREAADAFMLGNSLVFLLTFGVTYNAILNRKLDVTQGWQNWTGTFEEVLPGLVDAHGQVLSTVHNMIHGAVADRVIEIIDELCYPDPDQRGDRRARAMGRNPFDIGRYVTRLDAVFQRLRRRMGN